MHSRKQTWPLLALGTFTLFIAYAFWAWRAGIICQERRNLERHRTLRPAGISYCAAQQSSEKSPYFGKAACFVFTPDAGYSVMMFRECLLRFP